MRSDGRDRTTEDRERSRRRVASGENRHRMQLRQAKSMGMTPIEYARYRAAKTARRREREAHRLEREYEKAERKAKQNEIPDSELKAIASAYHSAYIMKRYRTEPAFRQRMLSNARRRNYRLRGVTLSDKTSLEQIAERDGWRCHICRRKVTTKTWSVDHLIPLSRGGQDVAENLALAHRRCNSRRKDGRIPAQLRLIG